MTKLAKAKERVLRAALLLNIMSSFRYSLNGKGNGWIEAKSSTLREWDRACAVYRAALKKAKK